MLANYNDTRTFSKYLSTDPDDAGLRVRLSGDLLLIYGTARANPNTTKAGKPARSSIAKFTVGCGSRMGRYLRECTTVYKYMHTLTYPSNYPSDGKTVKRHLKNYLQSLRRYSKEAGTTHKFSVFWFLEFQNRGAPHFHLLLTDFYPLDWCAKRWFDIVGSHDNKHLRAGVRVESLKRGRKGMISYARKYATKQNQKKVPTFYENVGRFWGVSGNKTRVAASTVFYIDSCRKPEINAIKTNLFGIIKSMMNTNLAKVIKREHNFAMFHLDVISGMRDVLQCEIEKCNEAMMTDDDLFQDAELDMELSTVYDLESGAKLTGADAYRYVKYGGNGKWR